MASLNPGRRPSRVAAVNNPYISSKPSGEYLLQEREEVYHSGNTAAGEYVTVSVGSETPLYQPAQQTSNSQQQLTYRLIQVPAEAFQAAASGGGQLSFVPATSGAQLMQDDQFEVVNVGGGSQDVSPGGGDLQLGKGAVQAVQLQTVDTPNGPCYFLMPPDGSGNSPKGTAKVTNATFIPLSRLDALAAADSPDGISSTLQPYRDKRRSSHNQVEKRRRDKINQWIDRLAGYLPDTSDDSIRTNQSKGAILAKTVDLINHLKNTNKALAQALESIDPDTLDGINIKHTLRQVQEENRILRKELKKAGLPFPPELTQAKMTFTVTLPRPREEDVDVDDDEDDGPAAKIIRPD